jgi:predicted phosphohydrolase
MRVFAISDLHLSGAASKPMSIFGSRWEEHWEKIQDDWRARVASGDIVLISGDISWAMTLDEAEVDLKAICKLPGGKILIRGNHDFWWSSISKVRRLLSDTTYALQNDSVVLDGWAFCGTRGWAPPGAKEFSEHDQKIYNRELQRLKMSLDSVSRDVEDIIVMLHYPPFDDRGNETPITQLLSAYKPRHVIFGHLHGESVKGAIEGEFDGIHYHLTSCDYLNFKLKQIL